MSRGSASRHITDSDEHATSVSINTKRRDVELARQNQLSTTYSASTYANLSSSHVDPHPSSRPDIFEHEGMPELMPSGDDDNDDDNDYYDNLFSAIDNVTIAAGIDPIAHDPVFESERLRRQVELMMMDAEHSDEFGTHDAEDDATVTNVVDGFRSLGMNIYCS